MSATTDRPVHHPVLGVMRIAALITAVGAVAQFLIGGYQFTAPSATLLSAHNVIGLVILVTSVVATVAAFLHARVGGNRGLMFHMLGTAVLILIQYALGEMATSTGIIIAHMVLGIVVMISAIAMTTLAYRKPFART